LLTSTRHWLDRNILELGREMRLSFLPPLMVYLAAGVSGLTGIVGTFFVKEHLGLSAAFLAALGFWAGIPWALKMPIGHLVDLIWRHKAALVWLGAALIASSLLIMYGLVAEPLRMGSIMSLEAWFVLSALLSPVGYVIQDVVADAMTVEAVPRVDEHGQALPAETRRLMNTTLQTLGRVAIIGGGVLVSFINVLMFQGVETLPQTARIAVYGQVYGMALLIPLISVAGVLLAAVLRRRDERRLRARGFDEARLRTLLEPPLEPVRPNWWILGGSTVFVAFSLGVGLAQIEFAQEIIFVGSFAIISFLMVRLLRELDEDSRRTLLGTAIIIFVFRAMPGPGAGSTWWMIDVLGFDQSFLARLSLLSSVLTLLGLFLFRRFMGERSIAHIVGFLTVAGTLLSLPTLGMYHGLHEWTALHTGGIVDARFIALIDTALESPLGQIAMVPMLAWIANSAPAGLKATYFAVMASFTNLALSASQLATKYLNQIYQVSREVRDPASNAVKVAADYGELGSLFLTAIILGLVLPFAAIWLTRVCRLRSA
jgi:MFS family permease